MSTSHHRTPRHTQTACHPRSPADPPELETPHPNTVRASNGTQWAPLDDGEGAARTETHQICNGSGPPHESMVGPGRWEERA
jgi:hypothetical protein